MNPAMVSLIVSLVEEAINETPALIADFQTILANSNPTAADFAALRAKVAGESYAQFVPKSNLQS